ncbi:hypothetical protein ACPV4A_15085 [Vibrio rotiferianus]|uniref:hypothetical protein n=1 Tax=Vibrio rotiferianus TaxID=190895 RepID=UPI00406A23A4
MFENKHLFIISGADFFFYLYAEALIKKAGVLPENIIALVFEVDGKGKESQIPVSKVTYLDASEELLSQAITAQTVTFMSLNRFNSLYMKKVLQLDAGMKDKMCVFLTDDEVDRWEICYKNKGDIQPDLKLHIAEDDLFCLTQIDRFIGHEKTFKPKLDRLLNRDVGFIDASVIFETLPCDSAHYLAQAEMSCQGWARNEKRILVGTKQKAFSCSEIRKFLQALGKNKKAKDFKLLIMWHKKSRWQRALTDLYLIWLRNVKRQAFDVSYVTAINPIAYTSLVMSCSHILLQRRGGASTVRPYIKNGYGAVCIEKGTPNHYGFKSALDLDILEYSSFDELVEKLVGQQVDITSNAEATKIEELRSIKVLSQTYS